MGKTTGITGNLMYCMADKGDYILVAFLDNPLMQRSAGTLIRCRNGNLEISVTRQETAVSEL